MGGGGSASQPKTYTPPPLQNTPVSPPIPNFFAGGQVGQSPYQAMAGFAPQPIMGPMGQTIAPPQFLAPQMMTPPVAPPSTPVPVPVPVAPPQHGPMTMHQRWALLGGNN